MGKGDRRSKAKRNREKLEAVTGIPGLDVRQPKRPRRGNDGRFTASTTEDPRKTALQARVHHFGGEDTVKGRIALSGQHSGSQLGMVMERDLSSSEIGPLWQTYHAWCMAEDAYRRRYLGQTEHPKGAAIKSVPDPMTTDTGHTVDLRDPEQKDRDAVSRWMQWQGYLGSLTAMECMALHDARLERAALWKDRAPTTRGRLALLALKALHVVVERKR